MSIKATIVCSRADMASMNICEHLRGRRDWEPRSSPDPFFEVLESRGFRLIIIEPYHIYQDGLDERLEDAGFPADLIVFASKHRSKTAGQVLTAHFTGNTGEAEYGGNPGELARAAPHALKSLLGSLQMLARNEDYEVTMESTHHGPTALDTPSVYVEIGSTEAEWTDQTAGCIVADAILTLDPSHGPVAVGFGGGHYAPRMTRLVLETNVTFGHVFPDYALPDLDESMVRQALERSNADFAYFDRNSTSTEERERLEEIIHRLGYEVLRESDIRMMDGLPWDFCQELRDKAQELCPEARPRLTDGIKSEVCAACACPRVRAAEIDPELLAEAEKLDKKRIERFMEQHNIAYLERENGTIAHVILGVDETCARAAAQQLTQELIDILGEHYTVKVDPENEQIILLETKFSPRRAQELGVEPGPMFGRLASGESVKIDGKTINPESVHEEHKRILHLEKCAHILSGGRLK